MNDPLLRLLALHATLGIVTGWGVLAAFLVLDVASLRTLIDQTGTGVPALILLGVFFAITFGSCAMGLGVMSHRVEPDEAEGPTRGTPARTTRVMALRTARARGTGQARRR